VGVVRDSAVALAERFGEQAEGVGGARGVWSGRSALYLFSP
jgi:hypothetical protein